MLRADQFYIYIFYITATDTLLSNINIYKQEKYNRCMLRADQFLRLLKIQHATLLFLSFS